MGERGVVRVLSSWCLGQCYCLCCYCCVVVDGGGVGGSDDDGGSCGDCAGGGAGGGVGNGGCFMVTYVQAADKKYLRNGAPQAIVCRHVGATHGVMVSTPAFLACH